MIERYDSRGESLPPEYVSEYLADGTTHLIHPEKGQLAFNVLGDPDGIPIFLLHGMPGGRISLRARGIVLERMGFMVITYDRPGYGLSDRRQGRSVVDCVEDVIALADELGIDQFGVVGRSGGGPHAMACAAKIPPTRLKQVLLCSTSVPFWSNWYEGMTNHNMAVFHTMTDEELIADLTEKDLRIQEDPRSLYEDILSEATESDKRFIGDVAIRNLFIESFAESARKGPGGRIDDALALRKDPGFTLEEIKSNGVSIGIWHGADDQFSPVAPVEQFALEVGANLRIEHGKGHFGGTEQFTELITRTFGN